MLRCTGVPRFDPGAEGIHLAWSGPTGLTISERGYDIQRRLALGFEPTNCVELDEKALLELRDKHEASTRIGRLLYGVSDGISPMALPDRAPAFSPPLVPDPQSAGGRKPTPPITPPPGPPAPPPVDVYTLELLQSTELAIIYGQAVAAMVVALSGGKAVDVNVGPPGSFAINLAGDRIDTILLYAPALERLRICVVNPSAEEPVPGDSWASVPAIVTGLTLPLAEADARLSSPDDERRAAEKRLVAGETFSDADLSHLAPSIREALRHPELGRAVDRILLMRSKPDQPLQEVNFDGQLQILQVPPRLRRVLGFGYFDPGSGLKIDEVYEYRITGYFKAEDLLDQIYDFHTVPTGTTLPASFRIRDLLVTLPKPAALILDPPPTKGALLEVSRRGLPLDDKPAEPYWLHPPLEEWSLTIDLPKPLDLVMFDVSAANTFEVWGAEPYLGFSPALKLSAGTRVTFQFLKPVLRIGMRGSGVLFAIRLPSRRSGIVSRCWVTPPVRYAPQLLPEPPPVLGISNLQQPPSIYQGKVDEQTKLPTRPHPGFLVEWLPAVRRGTQSWPIDLDAAPPVEAISYQIEHTIVGSGVWQHVLGGDNIVLGNRDGESIKHPLMYGADLLEAFPAHKRREAGAPLAMSYSDVFEIKDPAGLVREIPAFGSTHQYRIRAMDVVGRVSGGWIVSNELRLEKWIPPPLPVGPKATSSRIIKAGDGRPAVSEPLGPRARAILAGDPTLSAEDRALLGTHESAIELRWGWRQAERDLDPTAKEFRVYRFSRPPDVVEGRVSKVDDAGGSWNLTFSTDRWLQKDECKGQWLHQWIGDQELVFVINAHDGGNNVQIFVDKSAKVPPPKPVEGGALFGRPLQPEHQRPAFWDERVAVEPITSDESYQHIFFDLLRFDDAKPIASVWVGVSASDDQSYAPDELPKTVPNGGRPGNESSIAVCTVTARSTKRPVFSMPPPLGDVPEIRTEEPTGREVIVTIDLPSILPGALSPGEPVAVERCAADDLFAITRVTGAGEIRMKRADGSFQTIVFPNSGDQATVVSTLRSPNPERLATKYLLFFATQHDRPDEIFARLGSRIDRFAQVQDRLPPKPSRAFYRIRRADALGRLSAGAAILPRAVRVPSPSPAVAPDKQRFRPIQSGAELTIGVPDDFGTTHVLLFHRVAPFAETQTLGTGGELLRIPNRPDLYPNNGIRLRAPGGALLAPAVKSLADADVTIGSDGTRNVALRVSTTDKGWLQVWCAALTRDGIPSELTGPFTIGVGGT